MSELNVVRAYELWKAAAYIRAKLATLEFTPVTKGTENENG